MKKLLLVGGGGHCHSVLDSVLALGEYDDIGIIDSIDQSFLGVPVIGSDDDIPRLIDEGWTHAFISVGSVGNTSIRRKLYEMIKIHGLCIPVIIDPSAVVSKGTEIAEGVFVGKKAVVNAGSKINTCSIINTGAIIEHDCVINEFAHISPGSVICGQVNIGSDSHIGAGSVVRQQILVGDHALIGAGSVVVENIPSNVKAYGNSCKVVNR